MARLTFSEYYDNFWLISRGDEKMDRNEKIMMFVLGAFVTITAIAVVASNGGFISQKLCFVAIFGTFFVGIVIAGKLLLIYRRRTNSEN